MNAFKELLEKQKQERLHFLVKENENIKQHVTVKDFKYMTHEERMLYMSLCISSEFCIEHDMLDLMTYVEKTYWFKNSDNVYAATHIERTDEHKQALLM